MNFEITFDISDHKKIKKNAPKWTISRKIPKSMQPKCDICQKCILKKDFEEHKIKCLELRKTAKDLESHKDVLENSKKIKLESIEFKTTEIVQNSNVPKDNKNYENFKKYLTIVNTRTNIPTKFVCKFCSQVFYEENPALAHLKSDHCCQFCEQTFGKISELKSHLKTMHFKIRHPCDQCEKSFSHSQNLQLHIKLHHSKNAIQKI